VTLLSVKCKQNGVDYRQFPPCDGCTVIVTENWRCTDDERLLQRDNYGSWFDPRRYSMLLLRVFIPCSVILLLSCNVLQMFHCILICPQL